MPIPEPGSTLRGVNPGRNQDWDSEVHMRHFTIHNVSVVYSSLNVFLADGTRLKTTPRFVASSLGVVVKSALTMLVISARTDPVGRFLSPVIIFYTSYRYNSVPSFNADRKVGYCVQVVRQLDSLQL